MQRGVVAGAGAARVVAEDVAALCRAFGDRHVLGNDGGAHFVALTFVLALPNVFAHFATSIEAGEQVTAFDAPLKHRFEDLQGARHLLCRLERKIVGRDRDEQQAISVVCAA